MGKSLKNSVTPDEMSADYGADTFRLYEMSMGPMEVSRPWETREVVGSLRFLQRLWRKLVDEQTGAARVSDDAPADDTRGCWTSDRRGRPTSWRCTTTPRWRS